MACSHSQGFTFGKAGEILTKRLRYMVFRSMLRQVCVLRTAPGPCGAPSSRPCSASVVRLLSSCGALPSVSPQRCDWTPQLWLRGPAVCPLWAGRGIGSPLTVPRAGSAPAFVVAAGGGRDSTPHPFSLFLSFFPLGHPRHLCFFPLRDAT